MSTIIGICPSIFQRQRLDTQIRGQLFSVINLIGMIRNAAHFLAHFLMNPLGITGHPDAVVFAAGGFGISEIGKMEINALKPIE